MNVSDNMSKHDSRFEAAAAEGQTTVDEQTIIHALQNRAAMLEAVADRVAQGADPIDRMWPDHTATPNDPDDSASRVTILRIAANFADTDSVGMLAKLSRQRGNSWAEVGEALGISKQAAWERLRDYTD